MGNRVGADHLCDLDLALGDQRARDGGAEQILPLVESIGAEHREDEVADEFFAQILDENLFDAQHLRLRACGLKLFALADIGGEGDDLTFIGVLQPAQDDGRIEAAGIGKDDLFDRATHGGDVPRMTKLESAAV